MVDMANIQLDNLKELKDEWDANDTDNKTDNKVMRRMVGLIDAMELSVMVV